MGNPIVRRGRLRPRELSNVTCSGLPSQREAEPTPEPGPSASEAVLPASCCAAFRACERPRTASGGSGLAVQHLALPPCYFLQMTMPLLQSSRKPSKAVLGRTICDGVSQKWALSDEMVPAHHPCSAGEETGTQRGEVT